MSEWKESTISEIGDVISGGTPSTAIKEYWDKGEILFVTPNDLSKNKSAYIGNTERKITQQGLQNSSANLLPKGSVVISSRAPIGYIAVGEKEFTTNQGCKSIVPFSAFDSLFLYYNIGFYVERIKSLGEGTTFAEISKGDLEKIRIPHPVSKHTQRKIARILSTCDAVIEKTEAAIAKYKAIKQGMLQDLFTRGIDLKTGKLRPKYEDAPHLYKETELGWLPKEWEVGCVSDFTEYVDYRGKTPPKSEFGVFLITARNVKDGFIDYEASKEYIKEESYDTSMSRGLPNIGDVLITTEAQMGNVAQIDRERVALAQRIIKYRGHAGSLSNDFLALQFISDRFQRAMYSESTGSTVLGIKGSRLHRISITIPKMDEQDCIVLAFKSIKAKLEAEEDYLNKIISIKHGLMADLLTGKVPVMVEEKEVPA